MEIDIQTYENVVVVSPAGRVDHKTVDDFQTAFAPHVEKCAGEEGKIVLDLSGVDYMSSVGLRALMAAAKSARKQSGTIVVAGLQPTLQEIFEISRFVQIFQIFDNARAAIGELSETALASYDGGSAAQA